MESLAVPSRWTKLANSLKSSDREEVEVVEASKRREVAKLAREGVEKLQLALVELARCLKRLGFLERTLELVEEGSDASTRSCSICYEENLEPWRSWRL